MPHTGTHSVPQQAPWEEVANDTLNTFVKQSGGGFRACCVHVTSQAISGQMGCQAVWWRKPASGHALSPEGDFERCQKTLIHPCPIVSNLKSAVITLSTLNQAEPNTFWLMAKALQAGCC